MELRGIPNQRGAVPTFVPQYLRHLCATFEHTCEMPTAFRRPFGSAAPSKSCWDFCGRYSNVPRGNVTSIGTLPCGCPPCSADPHGLCYTFENLRFSTGDGETEFLRTLIESLILCRVTKKVDP